MKTILGLDLGTNSIGWALVDKKNNKFLGMGSRIIPMSQDILDNFGAGKPSKTQTAERTGYRSARRIRERHLLRRERLHRVLNVLDFLPKHYAAEICFDKHFGQFKEETEPKLGWRKNGKKQNGKDKFEFLFQKSFNEMIEDFKKTQSALLNRKKKNGESVKIPYDWTIYYLRKKALTQKIEKEELAWLLLNFNQKRGYYQARSEDDETTDKREYVEVFKIVKIEKGEIDKKNDKRTWYSLTLNNGWIYSATFTAEPQWLDTEKEFLVTEELDEKGNVKIVKDKRTDTSGKEKRKITPLPSFEEIDLMSKADQDKIYKKIKAKTELTISNSGKTVGVYIYDTLLQKPNQKIRSKLVRTIERKFYKDELRQILQKQIKLQPQLFTDDLYYDCVRELYRNNEAHQLTLSKRDFVHLFLDDIIFYQRPLRSQKSSIGNCSLEFRLHKINKKDDKGNPIKNVFEKDENGKDLEVKSYLKTIPKSNPYYQEFRLWQLIKNLSIYKKDDDSNVTSEFLSSTDDFEKLFDFLNNRKEIEQKPLIDFLVKQKENKTRQVLPEKATKTARSKAETEFNKKVTNETEKYRWNYVEDKKYPCNETRTQITTRLKAANVADNFLTREIEQQLWHIIYSVTDKVDFEKALKKFANKHKLDETTFVENFKKFPPFKSDYGSYSEKAIKKLLPLMRLGKYWNENTITYEIKNRVNAIIERLKTIKDEKEIENVSDDEIPKQILKSFFGVSDFTKGLRLYQASYLVYGRHSEAENAEKWTSVEDLKTYLKEFKQHSLRNPIVEQVVTETLRVVQDIWQLYGKGAENFFDEIHIELGREMKNPAEDRKRMTNQITENENTNLRIKLLLSELKNDITIENVREYSPTQQEILKIYEDGVLNSIKNKEYNNNEKDQKEKVENEAMLKVGTTAQPTKAELTRYKLWLEQKYCSPYTGEIIPLGKLFTPAYEIEHIIPQSRFFDDSFSNKVICEAAVNKLKDNQLGLEFIKNHHGQKVETGNRNETVEIFSEDNYRKFVQEHYDKNRGKRNKLLLEEIPNKMIERQLNDTRYISKYISAVLSNIVRADRNDDGVNSKNIVPGNGKITTTLKQDWGLNDVWNDLILPRFKRMNELTNTTVFTAKNKNDKDIPAIPLELSKGFSKKRIDHRHHAMDALVIACATRDHVNFLNNEHAKSVEKRLDLRSKLCYKKYNDDSKKDYKWIFRKPWGTNEHHSLIKSSIEFPVDAKNELEKIVVSFKQNLRVINKATNYYEKFENGKKVEVEQKKTEKGVNWAIRKPLHKAFVFGKVDLPWVKVSKDKTNVAIRRSLSPSIDINKITDTGIQKILKNYLEYKDNNPELAFSPEGIENMNKNIIQYNDGKPHQPILKVRTFEVGSRFPLGQKGNKKEKYVETADGTNLFFVVYQRKDTKARMFETVPLNEIIEHQKQQVSENVSKENQTPITIKKVLEFKNKPIEVEYLFYLSPNDLVYVPTEEERENSSPIDFSNLTSDQRKRLYNVNDFSSTCYFTPNRIAKAVAPKEIDLNFDKGKNKVTGSFDTKTASLDGEQIKEVCLKLKVDRLGNISRANQ